MWQGGSSGVGGSAVCGQLVPWAVVLEEVKSLGYHKIGPAPLKGHSLSNFEGQGPLSQTGVSWGRGPLV